MMCRGRGGPSLHTSYNNTMQYGILFDFESLVSFSYIRMCLLFRFYGLKILVYISPTFMDSLTVCHLHDLR